MPKGRKQSSKPNQSLEVKEEVVPEVQVVEAKIIEQKKTYTATGKFYAQDGFVIGKEGQVVSKKMDQYKAEEIAARFNR